MGPESKWEPNEANPPPEVEAYEFAEPLGGPEPEREWPVGEARLFERVKIRNAAGEHVGNGFECIGRERSW